MQLIVSLKHNVTQEDLSTLIDYCTTSFKIVKTNLNGKYLKYIVIEISSSDSLEDVKTKLFSTNSVNGVDINKINNIQ